MTNPHIDIIVPVWNRPIETRACLVNLVEHSPAARLILVNNGCDRETERLLEEFAEPLDERALLISSQVNLGFVKAINRGLARAEAEFAVVVRSSSLVSQGWLEPLLMLARTRPQAGVIVPQLVRSHRKRESRVIRTPFSTTEISHGDFAAMMIRTDLYDRIGGFDEEMDGAAWCLKDYSRRALRGGFLTFAAEGSPVIVSDEPPLGSAERREESLLRSVAAYRERWGEERAFIVHFSRKADPGIVRQRLDLMLRGARQGHSFTVLVYPATLRELARDGYGALHRNIRLEKLPQLFAARKAGKIAASLCAGTPGILPVAGGEEVSHAGVDGSISFADLERLISSADVEQYGQQV
jgi:GT2 family glycosyltransferase